MGKTPGKWIKTLLGKKSSKSSLLKKKEISKPADNADKGGALVSSNEPLPALPVEHPLVSAPFPNFGARNEVESEKEIAATLANPEVSLLSAREEGNAPTARNLASLDDSQKIRHEQAAIQAQAAFRGYLARRAFRTLKGIIKLQALIRGHLVRRQAVATLSCVWGIVKLQALARGQKVRRSDIGIEAQKIYSQGELLEAKYDNSCGLSLSTRAKRLRSNAYIQKLLATTPTSTPLHFQYGPGEANSVEEWLQRWTISRFWEPLPLPTNNQDPKPQSKHSGLKTKATDQTRPKRSVRKPSNANVENGSSRSASESEKRKRSTIRTVPTHTTDPVQEHPPIEKEKEKVKRNLRKTSDFTKDVSERSKVNEKTKHSLRKASDSPPSYLTELGATDSAENMKYVVTPEQSDLDTSPILPAADVLADEIHDQPNEIHDQSAVDGEPVDNNVETESHKGTDKEPNSDDINKENQKNSQRRASLPAKIDHQENGLHSTPKLPSYMAPTESAKARLRGQGSPRIIQEGVEKNGITRRLSLPSSTNGKLSSPSPRAQRLIQGSAKGVIKSDKSLLSSRDAGSKNT